MYKKINPGKIISVLSFLFTIFLLLKINAFSAPIPEINLPTINIGGSVVNGPNAVAMPLQLLALMSVLTLAPYILVMTTSFVRIIIVLSFLRTAIGTQQVPPTQILIAISLFLTLFIMQPYGNEMNQKALQPLLKGKISQPQAIKIASEPMRKFMLKQIRPKDLSLFVGLSKTKAKSIEECETYVLLPAFIISEVKTAFQMGFLIYLPFLIIDMVVASVLMNMGMFMLSPMTISTPFKLLLFVMIDGWNLLIEGLVKSFK